MRGQSGQVLLVATGALAIAISAGAALLISSCGDSASDITLFPDSAGEIVPNSAGGSDRSATGGSRDAGTPAEPPPPETENNYLLAAPVSSRNYVYVLNTSLGTIARIDPKTREVRSIRAGRQPIALATLEGQDTAVVLTQGDPALALVMSNPEADTVRSVRLAEPYDSLTVSPGRQYAIAWFNEGRGRPFDANRRTAPKVAIVDLTLLQAGETDASKVVVERSVGFRMTDILFDQNGSRAYLVSKAEIAVMTLDKLRDEPLLPRRRIDDVEFEDVERREFAITPDGSFILARSDNANRLLWVDWTSATRGSLTLPSAATDLDLSPDGRRALVVLRETNQVGLVDVPAGLRDESKLRLLSTGGSFAGQAVLNPARNQAALYTTVVYREELLLLDLDTAAIVKLDSSSGLDKAIASVGYAPGGESLVIIHRAAKPGESPAVSDLERRTDQAQGYSLVALDEGVVRLFETPVAPGAIAFDPSASWAGVVLYGGQQDQRINEVHLLDLRRLIKEASHPMPSQPEYLGALPGGEWLYVAQKHPLGRISFIPLGGGQPVTITGYEINAEAE
ncbi:MAG: hypothetical protein GMKNLPBB_01944 [Myxococcota bacterium]|nr:hypothetical protein [Myxococcota bacterium]